MQAAEGKLFGPLAFTKTFALVAALIVALFILPAFAHWFFGARIRNKNISRWLNTILAATGIVALFIGAVWSGIILLLFGLTGLLQEYLLPDQKSEFKWYHRLLKN